MCLYSQFSHIKDAPVTTMDALLPPNSYFYRMMFVGQRVWSMRFKFVSDPCGCIARQCTCTSYCTGQPDRVDFLRLLARISDQSVLLEIIVCVEVCIKTSLIVMLKPNARQILHASYSGPFETLQWVKAHLLAPWSSWAAVSLWIVTLFLCDMCVCDGMNAIASVA